MSNLAVVAPESAVASSVAMATDLLWMAARLARPNANDRVVVVTSDGDPVHCGNLSIRADLAIDDLDDCSLVWVAAFWDPIDVALLQNTRTIRQVVALHEKGAIVAAHGAAVALLAEGGLVDGRPVAVQSSLADQFAHLFPSVGVLRNRAIVESGDVFSAVGITSGCDLLVRLIDRIYGAGIADSVSVAALFDQHREYRLAPVAFDGLKYHSDAEVLTAQHILETQYQSTVSLEGIASQLRMSPRTLARRFRAATGTVPRQYLQQVRIEAAKDILRNSHRSISDVARQTGYADPSAFQRAFLRTTGVRPSSFRSD